MMGFRFRDKPVTSPLGIVACTIALAIGLIWMALWLCLLPFFLLLALVLHPIFRLAGRRGCIRENGTQVIFDKTSFQREA